MLSVRVSRFNVRIEYKIWGFMILNVFLGQIAVSATDQTMQYKPSCCFKRIEDEIWFDCMLLHGFDCIQLFFVFVFVAFWKFG